MPPAAPEEEYEAEPRDSSDFGDDKEAAYRDPAATQDQADFEGQGAATGGGDRSAQPGGPSADAAASKRAGKGGAGGGDTDGGEPDLDERLQKPAGGHKTGGKPRFNIRNLTSRRNLIIGGIVGLFAVGLPILFFLLLLPLELVHIEQNIVNYFDKRMQNTISNRQGAHFQAIFNDAGQATGFKYSTGNPISDAYHNYNLNRLESDMKAQGLSAVHENGKLVGFTHDTGTDYDRNTHAQLNGDKVEIRDNNGKLIDTISTSDVAHFSDLRGTKVADRRSAFRVAYSERYPEMGFFRLNIRTRALDARLGIKRRFLENLHEKISDKTIDITKNLRDAFNARVANTDGAPELDQAKEQQDEQDLENAANDHGGDAKGTSVKAIAAGGFSLIVQACGAAGIIDTVHKSLYLPRKLQEERTAFIFMSTADQIKKGDLHASQLSALMNSIQGFAKGTGWQRITGDKTVKVTDTSKFSLDGGDPVNNLDNVVHKIPGEGLVCGFINSWAGTVGILGFQVIFAIATSESADTVDVAIQSAVKGATQLGEGFIFSEAINQIIAMTIHATTSTVVDASSPPPDKIDAAVAGYDNYSADNTRSDGGKRLTAAQVSQMNQEADNNQRELAREQGVGYELFSPAYADSLTSTLILKMPTSPQDVFDRIGTTMSAILTPFSGKTANRLGSFLTSFTPSTQAFNAANQQEDPTGYGVPQQGFPNALLAKYPDPIDNEEHVISYLCNVADQGKPAGQRGLYDGECDGTNKDASAELTDQNDGHDDMYHHFVNDCLLTDDPDQLDSSECTSADPGDGSGIYDRFRVYRLDLFLANMNNSYNNTNDDQGSGSSTTGGSSGGSGTAPSSSAQQLAQQILSLAQAGKITLAVVNPANQNDGSTAQKNLEETAAGGPANTSTSCLGGGTPATNRTVPLSPTLLQFILDVSGQTSVTIDELAGGCHVANSNHYKGTAVDFGCPFDGSVGDTVGKKYGISDGTGETCSSGAAHYHYSIGGS